uniref:Uncharacterized protein n=1 Tax=Lepeophtheirus salmonis TaxID=72036 RepID=A0A0K2UY35_LEPSM
MTTSTSLTITSLPSLSLSGSTTPSFMCPCNPEDLSSKSELEINAEKMRQVMKNKTDLLSKIHHRATHSSDAYWASFILCTMGMSLIISVLSSKMWKESEYFITYTHCQPTVYPQYHEKSEILVKDLLKSKAKTAIKFGRGEDTVDSSSSTYQRLLTKYSSSSDEKIESSSSDEDFSLDEEDGYVYYYDSKSEQWIVGVKPKKESKSFWSVIFNKNYRRDRVSYKKLSSKIELVNSSDSDPQGSS